MSSFLTRSISVVAAALLASACGGEAVVESEELSGAADETASLSSELSTAVPVGSTLQATTAVNLRTGPSTGYRVILVVPSGARVTTVERTTPSGGWYKVRYAGHTGWSYGAYYRLVSSSGSSGSGPRDAAIARAKAGVGFSYWWGHGRWLMSGPSSSTRGSCSGSCPSCRHYGSYGADCSGYAAKVWAVPASNSPVSDDSHPYSTYNFKYERPYWHSVSRSSLRKGDALVYNANGAGHIVIYESGSGWGSMWAYECKGCAYGCVRNIRTASSAYIGIARNGW